MVEMEGPLRVKLQRFLGRPVGCIYVNGGWRLELTDPANWMRKTYPTPTRVYSAALARLANGGSTQGECLARPSPELGDGPGGASSRCLTLLLSDGGGLVWDEEEDECRLAEGHRIQVLDLGESGLLRPADELRPGLPTSLARHIEVLWAVWMKRGGMVSRMHAAELLQALRDGGWPEEHRFWPEVEEPPIEAPDWLLDDAGLEDETCGGSDELSQAGEGGRATLSPGNILQRAGFILETAGSEVQRALAHLPYSASDQARRQDALVAFVNDVMANPDVLVVRLEWWKADNLHFDSALRFSHAGGGTVLLGEEFDYRAELPPTKDFDLRIVVGREGWDAPTATPEDSGTKMERLRACLVFNGASVFDVPASTGGE